MKYRIIVIICLMVLSSCHDDFISDEIPRSIYIAFTTHEGIPIDEEMMQKFSFNGETQYGGNFEIVHYEEYYMFRFGIHKSKMNQEFDFEIPSLNYRDSFFLGETDDKMYINFNEKIIFVNDTMPFRNFIIPLSL